MHGLLQVDEQKGLDKSVQVAQDKEDDQEDPDVEVSEEAPDPLHACSFGQADVDFGEAEEKYCQQGEDVLSDEGNNIIGRTVRS